MNTQEVASAIRSQIGPSLVMFGANKFFHGTAADDGRPFLEFSVKGSKLANKVRVLYSRYPDCYSIEFYKIGRASFDMPKHVDGIQAENLRSTIGETLGLAWTLGTMGR